MVANETRAARRGGYLLFDESRTMGGGQLLTLRLARYVTACRPAARVRIACPAGSPLQAACRRYGIESVEARFPDPSPIRAPGLAAAAARVRRLLTEAARDEVVIGTSPRAHALLFVAALRFGGRRPIVLLLNEQDSARRRTARWVYRRFGVLIAVGANAARAYREALGGAPVAQINNFLLPEELESFAAARRPRATGKPPVLGVLARLIPEKGVLELVQELALIPDHWSELRVGGEREDAAYAASVEARAADLGVADRVRLIGHVHDVPAFMVDVDALVVPSVGNEGQPAAVLEGLAAGLRVIVRRSVQSRDFEGLDIVPFDGAEELAAALADSPREPADRDELRQRFGPEQALAAIDRAASPLALRAARESDRDLLLTWRNDPETRRWYFSNRPVAPAEHEAWFAARLRDPHCALWIVEAEGEPIGQVRVEGEYPEAAEVHIGLAPSARGRGHAADAIRQAVAAASRSLGARRFVARVKPGNDASVRAFRRAGFVEAAGSSHDVLEFELVTRCARRTA